VQEFGSMDVRPFQLMQIVSRLGEGRSEDLGDPRLNEILRAVREDPLRLITLRCNVTGTYAYQNPGTGEDTPEGALFNVRRDLRILQRMGLVPGATRPAIDLFELLLRNVESDEGISCFDETTSAAWRGTPRRACHYKAGHALGLGAIIPPRDAQEMARVKVESVQAMYDAQVLEIRPHHLMCITCFHGGQSNPAPIAEDNCIEAALIFCRNPTVPVRLVQGPCMICPPCPHYHPASGKCIGGHSMSLRDELKDLDVLQRLGLEYGAVLPAQKLLTLLYRRIPSALDICGHGDGVERSPEWRVCGGERVNERYAVGRAAGLGFLDPSAWA